MYLFDTNNIVLIKREFHIIDNLFVKTFINIDIIKSKKVILNLRKNVIIIDFY